VLLSRARHFTLTVPLSTQLYKWVLAHLLAHLLGVTLQWTSLPSRGEWKYSEWLHATEIGISLPDEQLGSYADLMLPVRFSLD